MVNKINLNKVVYNKDDYQKTIDTSFNELLPLAVTEEQIPLINIEQFFQYYNNLFFEIPKTGNNSHNTLIQQSSEYVGNEQTNDELDALYREVTNLRQELLETQTELSNLREQNSALAQNLINE